jgi:hypothetical protein
MADDLGIRVAQDSDRIDINEAQQLRYWIETFDVSEARLRIAVAAAGVEVEDVRTYLGIP